MLLLVGHLALEVDQIGFTTPGTPLAQSKGLGGDYPGDTPVDRRSFNFSTNPASF